MTCSRYALVAGMAVALACGSSAREAFAIKQFFEEFKAIYVKPESVDPAEKVLATEVESAKCNVCHVGSSKKERNSYGEALAERLGKCIHKIAQVGAALECHAGHVLPE